MKANEQRDITRKLHWSLSFPRNVLGRQGWLNQVRLALIDYDGKLFLSHYNDEIQ